MVALLGYHLLKLPATALESQDKRILKAILMAWQDIFLSSSAILDIYEEIGLESHQKKQ